MRVIVMGLGSAAVEAQVEEIISSHCEGDMLAYGIETELCNQVSLITSHEANIVSKLVAGLIATGSVNGVHWENTFYFGDADDADMFSTYLDDVGTIMVQSIIDEEIPDVNPAGERC